jgi:hypothetical protein
MRLDVMTAAAKYGCSDAALRRLFKSGGIEGRYEDVVGDSGRARRKLTFDVVDLAAAFTGPLAHLARRGVESSHLEKLVASMSDEERARLDARLDVTQAAETYACSEARIRQSYRRGLLRGEQTPFRDRDGRMSMKLTFEKADLDACFAKDATARERHEAHVATIRAAATPFSEEQKKAIAGVFLDHLREKREDGTTAILDDEETIVSDEKELAAVG